MQPANHLKVEKDHFFFPVWPFGNFEFETPYTILYLGNVKAPQIFFYKLSNKIFRLIIH